MSAQADTLKSVLFALGANLGIAVGKAVAAFLTGSGAMLAEAIHSFADSANQGLLLWGMRSARREADAWGLGGLRGGAWHWLGFVAGSGPTGPLADSLGTLDELIAPCEMGRLGGRGQHD